MISDSGKLFTISHIRKSTDGKIQEFQSNDDHCRGVAELAQQFASEFGMGDFGYILGILHDKGKEQQEFQNYILDQNGIPGHTRWTVQGKAHAYVGALMARHMYGSSADILFCNQIASHHSGLHDYCDLQGILAKSIPADVNTNVQKKIPAVPPFNFAKCQEGVHNLSRLLFSSLVDADYLDTERFMDGSSAQLRGNHTDLNALLTKLEKHIMHLQNDAADTYVNRIRKQVQEQCVKASSGDKGFYSLTVPTGGGKTLSSVLWAMRHAVHNGQKRIIIAIPYTSIIVQTASILKSIFGEENVLEHHSNLDDENIKNPINRSRAKLATENWDYPIIVTTNVQLFESMFSNKPSDCRKLHNIVNSVIILDEVQTLPTKFLQPIIDALKSYQSLFGVSVLFTTASQPVLSGIIEGCNHNANFSAISNIKEIIPAELNLHDKLRRVDIEIGNAGKTYDEVAQMLAKHKKVLCIVNTRKDAKELYDRLPKEGITLHLSRMMCPKHVRDTIEQVKTALKDDSNETIRVIATQLVEAGVDIDFPVVYRQEAGLDSVLQAAGRCNREGRLDTAKTYVFSLSKEHALPRGSITSANNARLSLPETSDWFAPATMTDYFRQLYCRCNTFDEKEICKLLYNVRQLCFAEAAAKFRLIEDDGINVIINWEDSIGLVDKLKSDGINYQLMKKLSQYTVRIHKNDFKKLQEYGAIDEILEGIYVVSDRAQYDKNIGLHTDNHWMEEILLI